MPVSIESRWGRAVLFSGGVHIIVLLLLGLVPFETPKAAVEETFIRIEMNEIPPTAAMTLPNGDTGQQNMKASAAPAALPVQENHTSSASRPRFVSDASDSAEPSAVSAAVSDIGNAAVFADATPSSGSGTASGTAGEVSDAASDGAGTGKSTGSAVDIEAVGNAFAARVDSVKEYPYMALRRGQTGVATLSVRLDGNGALLNVAIVSSSGVSALDESALSAVRRACPFVHGAGRTLEFIVPIYYELRG